MSEIDAAVSRQLATGKSLYRVDEAKLRAAAPDILVTQNLCQVCGPAGNEVSQVLKSMRAPPRIIWQTPRNFAEVIEAVRILGKETGTAAKACLLYTSALCAAVHHPHDRHSDFYLARTRL